MIWWNTNTQVLLEKYFSMCMSLDKVPFPFLLVSGPAYIGKTTCLIDYIHQLLWKHLATDFLALYDLTRELQSPQRIKVDVPTKDQILIHDEQEYLNFWTRDIVSWLALAPVGKYKVVFIENIERMTLQAANAFLKTIEEPLPGRLIIATTSQKDQLLDTIRSRAFIATMHMPSHTQSIQALKKVYPQYSQEQYRFILSLAWGRIGYARYFLDNNHDNLEEKSALFEQLLSMATKKQVGSVVNMYKLLQILSKCMHSNQLFEAILYALGIVWAYDAMWPWIHYKSLLSRNIQDDTVLFACALAYA